jgi:carbon storage regulator
MLVLSRKVGEAIVINDNIRITVVDIGQGRVKIGVHAPNNVSVDRQEIYDKKQLERQFADADPEAAVPINVPHNRIAQQLTDTAQTPPPVTVGRPIDFRKKSR